LKTRQRSTSNANANALQHQESPRFWPIIVGTGICKNIFSLELARNLDGRLSKTGFVQKQDPSPTQPGKAVALALAVFSFAKPNQAQPSTLAKAIKAQMGCGVGGVLIPPVENHFGGEISYPPPITYREKTPDGKYSTSFARLNRGPKDGNHEDIVAPPLKPPTN
jgi:hypothetical protein